MVICGNISAEILVGESTAEFCDNIFVQESAKEESLIIGRQHQEERMRRDIVEARMNRWYNRLLNRHQDDPVRLILLGVHVI